jgi:hypothetical protein
MRRAGAPKFNAIKHVKALGNGNEDRDSYVVNC